MRFHFREILDQCRRTHWLPAHTEGVRQIVLSNR